MRTNPELNFQDYLDDQVRRSALRQKLEMEQRFWDERLGYTPPELWESGVHWGDGEIIDVPFTVQPKEPPCATERSRAPAPPIDGDDPS